MTKKQIKNQAKPNKKPTKKEEQLRTKKKKAIMIQELTKSLGNITTACNKTEINRLTYYEWVKNDPKFKAAVEDIPEQRLDYYEKKLDELCESGNPAAVIFYLKTKGKNRGYIETQKQEIDMTVTKIDIKFEVPKEFKNITPKSYLPDDQKE